VSARSRPSDAVPATLELFYTSDPPMQACLDRARVAARTDLPLLILGESGSGKTMLARAIHNSSGRRSGPFVSFNAAALSETLIDSQLFGHERGAFTGAQQRVKGKFELADSGTLFLDEVADLTPVAQAKILRAVETGEFERLGSETLRQADVRVMSATHLDLSSSRNNAKQAFREDLYFRISGITIVVPPLRHRPRDLPALLAGEVERAATRQGKSIVGFDRRAADRLLAYGWPGNLRELSSVIHSAVALAETDVIGEDLLFLSDAPADGATNGRPATPGQTVPGRSLRDAARRHVATVLTDLGGNKRQAARELGISRATLDRYLQPPARRRR
jgi:DNA-binding NtrC family response regulator